MLRHLFGLGHQDVVAAGVGVGIDFCHHRTLVLDLDDHIANHIFFEGFVGEKMTQFNFVSR